MKRILPITGFLLALFAVVLPAIISRCASRYRAAARSSDL